MPPLPNLAEEHKNKMDSLRYELSAYHVSGSTDTFYIPEFVSLEEEEYLIRKIIESPQPKWKKLPNRRLQIWGGELTAKNQLIPQALPAYLTEFPDIIGRIASTGAFIKSPHGAPNHVILNEYLPGQGIMAHEDGPSYFPAVATLTLGSHAVFNYYRYKESADIPEGELDSANGKGRSVDTVPVLSMLLEPRSLVITMSDLYTSHLHGIDDIAEDIFPSPTESVGEYRGSRSSIANANFLGGREYREVLDNGGVLKRDVRYSLTCRDVERVVKLNARVGFGRR